jgi:hypothetical protein
VSDWKAHLIDDWATGGHRLILTRRHNDTTHDVIEGFTEHGDPIVHTHSDAVVNEWQGFRLPMGAAEAIAQAVRPGPTMRELSRLEDALTVERGRLDLALDRLLPASRPR